VLKARMVRDGMLPTCYCPLAMPTRFTPPEYEGICKTRHMEQLAEVTGFTPARMILSWAVDNHNAVIVKAQDPKHIKENAKVSTGMLSEPQRRMVQAYEQMYGSARVINPNSFRDDGKPFFPC
jgi:diketogulonate reductase-like aldo/keto reductase